MYKKDHNRQSCLTDFNQPIGLKMDPDNRWVKKAETIPWDQIKFIYSQAVAGLARINKPL